ncbi:mannose-1-phosphate guanylyltransferase [Sphingomonas sp. Root710]|uniref:nucleotidyltransferase family protein n=1 Tax=Sphingomonas sp. Root710 TaxID=1736594 RepID=UPI0006FE6206|nr:nucleotidyltransferase family protein [Sphingomonas sp. Root710]KRB79318.1 mannose-1-phosphate guanylyltransferase [Sphingomonas sp. Root710]
MSEINTAMVLAAGLGKRMRPLTATRPKPLVEVAGKPLLDHVLDRIRAAGIGKVVVNVHYLADALEAHLRRRAADLDIKVSDERSLLLETGGGIAKALPLIGEDSFLIANSDNLWIDGPRDAITLLTEHWDEERMDALLLLVPLARANCHSGLGDFHMDPAGRIIRRRPSKVAPFVYTGIQIVSKRMFTDIPEGPFGFMLLWERAIAAGRAYGFVHQGLWFDVGTPPAIGKTEALLGLA